MFKVLNVIALLSWRAKEAKEIFKILCVVWCRIYKEIRLKQGMLLKDGPSCV
jgi:hypothetical protein